MKAIDISGQVFGRLTAVACVHRSRYSYWRCLCQCGNETVAEFSNLRSGRTRSCGCLIREIRHGYSGRTEYTIWERMKSRCLNQNDSAWPRYGGRGITICERWMNSFKNFFADMGHRPPGKSIDRVDNELGYYPGNCRWATPKEQANNRGRRRTWPT